MKKSLSLALLGFFSFASLGFCAQPASKPKDSPAASADEETKSAGKDKWREYFGLNKRNRPDRARKKQRESDEESNPEGMLDLVDAPTTNVVDYGAYRVNFRFYSAGGVLSHMSFGVFKRLNIGASWDVEQVLGSEDPKTVAPALNVKFRVYDGSQAMPSIAVGYDGQGRFYDRGKEEYSERERGLYIVFGRELFFSNFLAQAGADIAKFRDGEVFGFAGLSYMIEEKVALFSEYDNIRVGPNNRWNAGIRIFPIPSLGIDFAVRQIASIHDKERIVRINYVGTF